MAVHGVRLGERTRDELRDGENLCLGCRLADGCDEKAEGCAWRRYHEGKRAITRLCKAWGMPKRRAGDARAT